MPTTRTDEKTLRLLPNGWFSIEEVPDEISRVIYRLTRLHDRGHLDMRINPAYDEDLAESGQLLPDDYYQYSKRDH